MQRRCFLVRSPVDEEWMGFDVEAQSVREVLVVRVPLDFLKKSRIEACLEPKEPVGNSSLLGSFFFRADFLVLICQSALTKRSLRLGGLW